MELKECKCVCVCVWPLSAVISVTLQWVLVTAELAWMLSHVLVRPLGGQATHLAIVSFYYLFLSLSPFVSVHSPSSVLLTCTSDTHFPEGALWPSPSGLACPCFRQVLAVPCRPVFTISLRFGSHKKKKQNKTRNLCYSRSRTQSLFSNRKTELVPGRGNGAQNCGWYSQRVRSIVARAHLTSNIRSEASLMGYKMLPCLTLTTLLSLADSGARLDSHNFPRSCPWPDLTTCILSGFWGGCVSLKVGCFLLLF